MVNDPNLQRAMSVPVFRDFDARRDDGQVFGKVAQKIAVNAAEPDVSVDGSTGAPSVPGSGLGPDFRDVEIFPLKHLFRAEDVLEHLPGCNQSSLSPGASLSRRNQRQGKTLVEVAAHGNGGHRHELKVGEGGFIHWTSLVEEDRSPCLLTQHPIAEDAVVVQAVGSIVMTPGASTLHETAAEHCSEVEAA